MVKHFVLILVLSSYALAQWSFGTSVLPAAAATAQVKHPVKHHVVKKASAKRHVTKKPQ